MILNESTYNYTTQILLYGSLAVLASITLVGCFIVLCNVSRTEAKANANILKVRLELYKEAEMRAINDNEKDKKEIYDLVKGILNKNNENTDKLIKSVLKKIDEELGGKLKKSEDAGKKSN